MKLTFSSRIFAGYLLTFGLASWIFYDSLIDEIKPVVRQSAEAILVDTANILAELVAEEVANSSDLSNLTNAISRIQNRNPDALIWDHLHNQVSTNFYITNAQGIVIFSSENKDIGEDYSLWRDVVLTLKGQYGARSTRINPEDPATSIMHIAAPVKYQDELVGVLTVYSPNSTMNPFIESSKKKVLQQWSMVLLAGGLIGGLISFWLSRSISKLVQYANSVKTGAHPSIPNLVGSELKSLALALDDMRKKLEGKAYVENYVQVLTHELKSPIAAIQGATEMLREAPPAEIQDKFLGNISSQTTRLKRSIEQLLRLAALENLTNQPVLENIYLNEIISEVLESLSERIQTSLLKIHINIPENLKVQADSTLLALAVTNLIENAIEFSSKEDEILISAKKKETAIELNIIDQGAGIPDYAQDRILERFYSLPRPNGAPKSTGLGLALAQEILRLHNAQLSIVNNLDAPGVKARVRFFM